MEINPLVTLAIAWVLGIVVGLQIIGWPPEHPTLLTIMGFVLFAGMSALFYFGRFAVPFIFITGMLEAYLMRTYPLATLLLGVCSIAASMYGKTLGELALEDFYQDGKTRLPGLSVGAIINFFFILAFTLLVWYLYEILPTTKQLGQVLSLPGFGV